MAGKLSQVQSGASSAVNEAFVTCRDTKRQCRWCWWVGGLVLAVYLFTASGHVQTLDAQQEIQVATRMVSGHGLSIVSVQFQGGGTLPGRDGKPYAAHDLGMSFVYAPLALVPGTVDRSGEPTELFVFLAGFVNAVIGGATALVMADVLFRLGVGRLAAALATLGFAFATMQWVYAHIAFDVPANALGILASVWCVIRARAAQTTWWLLAGGTALGVALTIRTDTLLLAPCISIPVVVLIWQARHQAGTVFTRALAWALPLAGATTLNGWYNWFRFGSVYDNGHLHDPLLRNTTPLAHGLAGQLVSPGKGILFFSPFVLMALAAWPTFIRREGVLAVALATAIVANLLAHARLTDWSGAEAWGSRHTMQVLAVLMLPSAFLLDDLAKARAGPAGRTRPHRLAAGAFGLLALAGVAVQLTAVGADYLALYQPGITTPPARRIAEWQAVDWRPADSQIWLGAAALKRSLEGRAPYADDRHGGRVPAPIPRFDLWWIRELAADRYTAAATIATPLLAIAALAAAVGLLRALRDDDQDIAYRRGLP